MDTEVYDLHRYYYYYYSTVPYGATQVAVRHHTRRRTLTHDGIVLLFVHGVSGV